jgi:hypothetical protein
MRKKLVAVVVAVLIVVTGPWFLDLSQPHRINRDGFERIIKGMTQQEVEKVLGKPPGDYTDRRTVQWAAKDRYWRLHSWTSVPPPWWRVWMVEWISDDGKIEVGLDEEDRVVVKWFYSVDDCPERPWTERVRRAFPPLPWTR